jgi:HK97 family phage major capsid protein
VPQKESPIVAFTHTTGTSAYAWRPDVTAFAPDDVLPDALILQCTNVAGSVEGDAPSVRVAYVNDDTATFVAEGDPIPESEPELAEVAVFTGKLSQLVRVSREQFAQEGTAAQVSASVARALIRAADTAFLNQAVPTPPATNPAGGILNHPDIIDGDEISGSLDALTDLVAEIQGNNGQPTHILLAPDAWGQLRKLKIGTDFNSTLLGAGVADAELRLLGIPVIVNPAVPSLSGVVLDSRAIVSAVSQVLVSTSQDVYFASDSVGLRSTWRIGQALVRPDRVATFTVAGSGS